ncbi:MAG: small ribosomal subunit Rsm22 family protein [Chthoniobacter sp.]|nr:small ribosomal subunit Rsm22 family protein [Chthoniobacter sp.]
MIKYFTHQEVLALRRMRERFLAGTAGAQDYWQRPDDIALYDTTFAERIGWKWDGVLAELHVRAWQPQSRHVLDWGCGSGVAGRRVLAQWPHLESLALHDRSPLAMRFATEKARADFPGIHLAALESPLPPDTLLVLSHVISELSAPALDQLLSVAREAREIIWVEAGTHVDSRRLISVRETLRGRFSAVAPCTHQHACGLLAGKNAQHWCHHFARSPSEIFQNARWMDFGRELGIDLRSLPYSFLVLERPRPIPMRDGFSHIIGEPREGNGHLKVLSCHSDGVAELMLQKRDAAALYRVLRKGDGPPVHRWELTNGKITGSAE